MATPRRRPARLRLRSRHPPPRAPRRPFPRRPPQQLERLWQLRRPLRQPGHSRFLHEPAPTAQAPPTSVPTTPPSTATAVPPSPNPSPVASPVASPSPTTPAATPPPAATERPTAAPARAPTPARAVVGRIATALTVDGLQRPQDLSDTFGLDDRVYISVEFRDVREGARLGFRWSSGSCGGEYETGPQQVVAPRLLRVLLGRDYLRRRARG